MFHAAKVGRAAQNAMPLAKWGGQAGGGLVVGVFDKSLYRIRTIFMETT